MADIAYTVTRLRAATTRLAASDAPLHDRLQRAWTEHVQLPWEDRYLPETLNGRFSALWQTYTAPSDDRRATGLREMSDAEVATAIGELVDLAFDTEAAAAS